MIELDGTENKSHLGANAILAVSLAAAHAAANDRKLPLFRHLAGDAEDFELPVPMMNIINGGAHADNNVDIQEFMILPVGAPSLSEAMRYGAEIFHTLKKVLHKKGLGTAVGDEGGFAPESAVERGRARDHHRSRAARGLHAGRRCSTSAWTWRARNSSAKASIRWSRKGGSSAPPSSSTIWRISSAAIPIITIEDGMSESDWQGWALLTQRLGRRVQLVGDDLFVTNTTNPEAGHRARESPTRS